jgi:molecular chaperone HtpG
LFLKTSSEVASVTHKFQVHLRGIIDLLSHHMYSGPQVFIRELLQNGVDAIQARRAYQKGHVGEITLEIILGGKKGSAATLIFTDNGIGLTEAEIHEFLATIGQSSKRGEFQPPGGFLGQFGVGLLACFIVSNEVVVVTRSAREPVQAALEWRGRQDGTYTIKTLGGDLPFGTQIYLTCKPGSEEFFEPDRVRELVEHFGSMLPVPIRFVQGQSSQVLNAEGSPWTKRYRSKAQERKALLDFGRRVFNASFFDVIPLHSEVGKVVGIAFVLPYSPSLAHKRTHRVYLKNMLLSESAEGLLPEWAFFVKCVVNVQDLRPTASRESFYEDNALAEARETLGVCLRDYLIALAEDEPERLHQLIQLHHLSMKALAAQDDDFFRIIIDYLPFETTLGVMTLKEFRRDQPALRYVANHDQYRQIAGVAAAQGEGIIDGGYVYDADLLDKYGHLFPEATVEQVDAASFAQSFEELSLEEQEECFHLLRNADAALRPYRCQADIKKFLPPEMPTLYHSSREGEFLRSVERSKDIADELWSGVLSNLSSRGNGGSHAQLFFNHRNPLIRTLVKLKDSKLLKRAIQMLYVQALLMGHHPLQGNELSLLTEGLSDLIEECLARSEREKP